MHPCGNASVPSWTFRTITPLVGYHCQSYGLTTEGGPRMVLYRLLLQCKGANWHSKPHQPLSGNEVNDSLVSPRWKKPVWRSQDEAFKPEFRVHTNGMAAVATCLGPLPWICWITQFSYSKTKSLINSLRCWENIKAKPCWPGLGCKYQVSKVLQYVWPGLVLQVNELELAKHRDPVRTETRRTKTNQKQKRH